MRDTSFCDGVVEDTVASFGRIDVLVNNAGVYVAGTALETSDEHWDATP